MVDVKKLTYDIKEQGEESIGLSNKIKELIFDCLDVLEGDEDVKDIIKRRTNTLTEMIDQECSRTSRIADLLSTCIDLNKMG